MYYRYIIAVGWLFDFAEYGVTPFEAYRRALNPLTIMRGRTLVMSSSGDAITLSVYG